MIEVRELKKEYRTGDFIQKALDGVSVTFRDNEFVAVLGPSGSVRLRCSISSAVSILLIQVRLS